MLELVNPSLVIAHPPIFPNVAVIVPSIFALYAFSAPDFVTEKL